MERHSSHLRRLGVCLRHQPLNQMKENLLWTLVRRCTWSAKRIWIPLNLKLITANGEVQTHEEVTVHVKDLDTYIHICILALRWTRTLTRVDQRSKTTSHQKRYSDTVQCGELRTGRGSWFINKFFLKLALFNIWDTFAGNWSSHVFLKLVYFTNHLQPCQAITIPQLCQLNMWKGKNGETRAIPKYRNGCKNSERILWMTEFLKMFRTSIRDGTKFFYLWPWMPFQKQKVIDADNSLEFGKACEESSWNHRTSTPHSSETNGAVRRIKEGTSAVLLQSGLDEKWWADSMECCCYLRNVQDLLSDGKTPIKSCSVCSLDMRCTRGESGKETLWSQTLENWKRRTHQNSTPEDWMQRKC